MAPKDRHGSGSKPVNSRSGKYRIKSSLFRQPPLVPDAHDADPISTNIFSNRDQPSTSNPSGPVPTNSTYLSSDSSISFRRERLGLYVQNYVPPPEPQYKGLQAAHREPQPKPEPPIDWGGWDIPKPKADNADENTEPVLWGGAPAGDNTVKWAPTSGKGKKKNKSKASRFRGHFLEPPVARIKVDIQEKGVKWRTCPINGGPGTGLGGATVDCQTEFMPWDAPETDGGLNCTDTEMAGVNTSSVAGNADGRDDYNSHQRSGFYFLEPRRTPFVIEVSEDEDKNSEDDEDEVAYEE
ncbi:hypothetical protein VF21_03352 [Pseudogymnoascus sp. 05NY08]|nr:hypothetical protein VF21_03352 [Pseudogymnoascus sp. 05NY08]